MPGPCDGPKAPQERRVASPSATALGVRDVISLRSRVAVVVGLGSGLRQGEVFGLSPEAIDYARGVLHVRRQIQAIHGRLYVALPKGKRTRTVDIPSAVAMELKRHVEAYPPREVELPWGKPDGKPALAEAGVIPSRAEGVKPRQWAAAPKNGFHVLRHTYASIMLEA
jgi:integrase